MCRIFFRFWHIRAFIIHYSLQLPKEWGKCCQSQLWSQCLDHNSAHQKPPFKKDHRLFLWRQIFRESSFFLQKSESCHFFKIEQPQTRICANLRNMSFMENHPLLVWPLTKLYRSHHMMTMWWLFLVLWYPIKARLGLIAHSVCIYSLNCTQPNLECAYCPRKAVTAAAVGTHFVCN